jgi:hypothetical protein
MAARLKPLRHLPPPRYPTWDRVREDPSLLLRELPARWQRHSVVVAALTAAALGTSTAARQTSPAKRPIAVVFEHGQGQGSYGCVSVAPPAFLSEEEARQVVASELSRAGLTLVPGGKTIPDLVRHRYYLLAKGDQRWDYKKARVEETGAPGLLTLDGYDAAKRVGYVLVSQSNYREKGGLDSAEVHFDDRSSVGWSSVGTYEFAEAARNLAKRINARENAGDKDAIGVFYDPSFGAWEELQRLDRSGARDDWQARMDQAVNTAKSKSLGQLREQVRDFAAWLYDQGILR